MAEPMEPLEPTYSLLPWRWQYTLEERDWIREMAAALMPFIEVADKIPVWKFKEDSSFDQLWNGSGLTVAHWLELRRVATGVAYAPEHP